MANNDKALMPLIPLRGLTVFPYMVISFDAGREKTVAAINEAIEHDRLCILVSQKDSSKTEVGRTTCSK
jgi:ATP-dependent Lon protease